MIFPAVAGSSLLWYLYKSPNRKSVAKLNSELRLKGFGFSYNCKKFIIADARKAYRWAYQLGEYFKLEFGSIDNHFYQSIDPNKYCVDYFRQNFEDHVAMMPKNDMYFYLELIRYYFQGLVKAGIPFEVLNVRYREMVKIAVMKFGLNASWIGRLVYNVQ